MPWYLALLLVATLLAGATGIVIVNIRDRKPRYKQVQDDFSLMLDTPGKKTRNLKEHREWDAEFYSYCLQPELIVYNGKLVTIDEANGIYFIEEEKRKRND